MKFDILIINGLILPKPGTNKLIKNGFLGIQNGLIAVMGTMDEITSYSGTKIIDAQGMLVMPGLINSHCHAAMTLFRGLADDLALANWLHDHIFPAEAKNVNPEMVYWCSKLAAAEMILSGTSLVADGYFHEHDAARAFSDAGIRAIPAQGIIDFPAPGVPDPDKNIEAAETFVSSWLGKDPLITPGLFVHSPYTCSPQTIQKAKELAREKNIPFFIHVAETSQEPGMVIEPLADTVIQHLDLLGVLDEKTICVHCVWLNDKDLSILSKRGVGIAHCPQSNLKLASGIAPLSKIIEQNIPVALGTDGCASNNSLDLFREMDICAKLHKIPELNPTSVPAEKVLQMASINGAKMLGFDDKLGQLKVGAMADLIIINQQEVHLQPFYNPDLLVYSPAGADVQTSIINGRVVMQDRKILSFDINETLEKVRNLAKQLVA